MQVITRKPARAAGALSEALRLADGMYVGSGFTPTWLINARGLSINVATYAGMIES